LSKLVYIMSNTKDEALQAAVAKTIIDASGKMAAATARKEDGSVGEVKFSIQVENAYMGTQPPFKPTDEPVIITIEDPDHDQLIQTKQNEIELLQTQINKQKEDMNSLKQNTSSLPINEDTGLPYIISYEGVNSYDDEDR